MNKPLISIIVPVYNSEEFVGETVECILEQSYENFELFLINDGSTDNSEKIIEDLSKKDKRIKLYSKKNEGLGLTRNYGMKRANGEYILFIDSDDKIEKDFLRNLLENAEKNKRALSICSRIRFNEKGLCGKKESSIINNSKKKARSFLDKKDFLRVSSCGCLYNTKIVNNNGLKFKSEREYISEDIVFNIEYSKYIDGYILEGKTPYQYRIRQLSLTTSIMKDRFEKNVELYNYLMNNYGEEYLRAVSSFFISSVRHCIKEIVISNQTNQYKRVSDIVNCKQTRNAIRSAKTNSFKQKVINTLIRLRLTRLIIFIEKGWHRK